MYDTVNFWLDRLDIAGGNPFVISNYLSEITEHQNKKGYGITGSIFDYTVNVYEGGISMKGSLPKSVFNDNIHTLTRSATQQAIEKISDTIHIDFNAAKVTRVDISTVIPTKRPPTDYYSYLGQKPYFNRLHAAKETLYYNNHKRQLIFYDKVKEAAAKGVTIPPPLQGCNLLRYELRYTKGIKKQFKTDVTAQTLYDEDFYYSIVQSWHNEFKTIHKLKGQNIMIDDMTTPKKAIDGMYDYAMAYLLQEDPDFVDRVINDLKASKKFNRSDYSKMKKKVFAPVAKNGNKNDMINELETAIFEAAKYAR